MKTKQKKPIIKKMLILLRHRAEIIILYTFYLFMVIIMLLYIVLLVALVILGEGSLYLTFYNYTEPGHSELMANTLKKGLESLISQFSSTNNDTTSHMDQLPSSPADQGPPSLPSLGSSESSSSSDSEENFNVPSSVPETKEILDSLTGKTKSETKSYFKDLESKVNYRAEMQCGQVSVNATSDLEAIEMERQREMENLKEVIALVYETNDYSSDEEGLTSEIRPYSPSPENSYYHETNETPETLESHETHEIRESRETNETNETNETSETSETSETNETKKRKHESDDDSSPEPSTHKKLKS